MAVDFAELDYSDIFLNPMVVPAKQDPTTYYKEWREYPEFRAETPNIDRKKLFRYIPLVYGKSSPLHGVLNTIEKVKAKAAELSGFSKIEGKYLTSVEDLMTCKDPVLNAMILRYITLHRQSKYHEFCVFKEVHFKLGLSIIEDPDSKDLKNYQDLGERIDDMLTSMFNTDTNKNLKDDMHLFYIEDRIRLRPEDIAEKRKEGVDFKS